MESLEEVMKLICGFLEEFQRRLPWRRVGSLILQKMLFLFEQKKKWDLSFSLNHRGPFSELVELGIDRLLVQAIIEVISYSGGGSFIRLNQNPYSLAEEDRELIRQLVDKYGQLSSEELVILTTAIFLKNRYEIESKNQLIDLIQESRPQMTRSDIKEIVRLI